MARRGLRDPRRRFFKLFGDHLDKGEEKIYIVLRRRGR